MPGQTRLSAVTVRGALGLACLLVFLTGGASAASAQVDVFPVPGSRVASPQTQIAFRGVPAGTLGAVTVTGSRSGSHSGTVRADSDGKGASFLPAAPFSPGENVTVSTSQDIAGARGGSFQFAIATPAPGIPASHWPPVVRNRGDVSQFHSRSDLAPASVTVSKRGAVGSGDIFLAPQWGPLQDGPLILDSSGNLVWFKRLRGDDSASDFRSQTYQGQPVLTWWQGYVTGGVGVGEDVIDNSAYEQIAVVHAANGLSSDLHEFEISPSGTALITAVYPVRWNLSSVHGPANGIVYDSVVQEIDIPTGLVLFQWDSLDHVPLTDTYQQLPKNRLFPFDYFHVNSVEPDRDGNLVLSARNTWAAYKVDHGTAKTIWTLGGRRSSFKMGPGASFAFQHDVRVRSSHDWFITVFDDGSSGVHTQSRGLKLFLDLKRRTASRVAELDHSPSLSAGFEGNYQQLTNGDGFLGWGEQPNFTEYNSRGQVVFDGHFLDGNPSYRAYRFSWSGTPRTLPAVAATNHGHSTTVYASWNGATNVASWRVLGGTTANGLKAAATAGRQGFETSITIGGQPYVAVQALDGQGRVLATSAAVRS